MRFFAVALLTVALPVAPVRAQHFAAPVQLSQYGYANSAMAGMDQAGNALAVWADEGSWYSTHAPGQAWSAPQSVYIGGGLGLTMQMTAAGFATIASYSVGNGIYTIDRPPGGSWTAPATVVSGPDVVTPSRTGAPGMIFAANPAGTQVIVWQQDNSGLSQIMAVHRPAGGAWGAAEVVAVAPANEGLALASAAIGPQGDVLVAWETFEVTCSVRNCAEGNFIVHASREQEGVAGWVDSGPLTPGIGPDGYVVRALVDAAGQAGLVMQAGQFPSSLLAARQKSGGAAWGALTTAYSDVSGGYPTLAGAAATGPGGRGSYAAIDYGSPLKILFGDGALAKGTWAAPVDLSASDTSTPGETLASAANAVDGAIVTWVDADDTVRAALRKSGKAAFVATTIVPGDSCLLSVVITACKAPGAVALNAAGQAVSLFLITNSTATQHTLFATTTN